MTVNNLPTPITSTQHPDLRPQIDWMLNGLPPIEFTPRDDGEVNYYGAHWTLARALGMSAPLHRYETVHWSHGPYEMYREPVRPEQVCTAATVPEYKDGGRGQRLLVNNEREARLLREFGYTDVHAVGAPFIHEPWVPEVERRPRSVIVFPTHSTTFFSLFDPKVSQQSGSSPDLAYPREAARLRDHFDLVVASIGASDVLHGNWINAFEAHGIPWVTGAWIFDRWAYQRMQRIFRSFEYVATNSFGSHIYFALYCGCKVFWYGDAEKGLNDDFDFTRLHDLDGYLVRLKEKHPHLTHDVLAEQSIRNFLLQKRDYPFLFVPWEKATAREEVGQRALGAADRRPPEEVAQLLGWELKRSARGWQPANADDLIPTEALSRDLNDALHRKDDAEILRLSSVLGRRHQPVRFAQLARAAALHRRGRWKEASECVETEEAAFGAGPESSRLRKQIEAASKAAATPDFAPFLTPELSPNNADRYIVRSAILRAVEAFAPRMHGTLLDVGCGIMPYRGILTRSPSRVTRYLGMDIETEIYRAEVDLRWDGTTIPLEDASVDCAMATEVLEHCPEPLVVLKEIRRVLKPGGTFFFTVPYIWPLHDAPWDFYRYTPFALERLLAQAGFEGTEIKALGGWNASLAQMIGLWLKRAPMSPDKRNEMAKQLYPFYKQLLAEDQPPHDVHAGDTMATGWSGSARVPAPVEAFDSDPSIVPSALPLCLVRAQVGNYSETFLDDHVRYVSRAVMVLHGYPYPRFRDDGSSVLGAEAEALLAERPRSEAANEAYFAGVADFLRAGGFPVVLIESGLMAAYLAPACERAGVPFVVHFHGADAYVHSLVDALRQEFFDFFRSAAAIVGVSRAMVERLASLGAPRERLVLAPYGVATEGFEPARPAENPPHFLAVGRLVEKKAPLKTIEAFARVRAEFPDARLRLVGDGPLEEQARRKVAQLGLEGAVDFLGVRSRAEVQRLMQASRAFVQHSVAARDGDSEGLPLAILEAGACGLPVVATRHAGIPDAVREGEDGYLVDEGDVAAMAEGMRQLAADPALAGRMGASYRERVLTHYSRRISLERLQGIVAQAAETGKAALEAARAPFSREELEARLPTLASAGSSVRLANEAQRSQCPDLEEAFLFRALAFDRALPEPYLRLAHRKLEQGNKVEAWLCLREAARCFEMPPKLHELARSLSRDPAVKADPLVEVYRAHSGALRLERARKRRRILIFTNLLPPQEMGGYGRTVWEFADLLLQRGHAVHVLTGDLPHLHRAMEPAEEKRVEPHVTRSLRLYGDWREGRTVTETDEGRIRAIARHNRAEVAAAIERFKPEVVMAGNLDFLSPLPLYEALGRDLPVVHRLGNALPGYNPVDTPKSPRYCIAGCSEWVNTGLRDGGFAAARFEVLPPGSPLERYYRLLAPSVDRLRICFAGLLQPYKGAQILLQALALLKRMGIPFKAELAGEATDPTFLAELKRTARDGGFAEAVHFPGFLGKDGLAALYARSNVMVFPSVFEEPFGKSQIEAMAAGVAVVSSGTGGSREIVRDNENGLIFKSGDPEDLARQLFILQANPELWTRLGAQGQADAFQFTTLQSVLKLEGIFEGLCAPD
jgi:glycosyltransferase involved in cell wall biosynthesis